MLTTSDRRVVLDIINSMGASVFLIDVMPGADFRVVAINRRGEDEIGLKDSEVAGKRVHEVLAAEHAERLADKYRKCVAERCGIDCEHWYDTPQGRRWVRIALTPVLDERGDVARIMGTTVLMTEQQRMEEELGKREAFFRSLVEHARDLIVECDMDGNILYASPSIERLLGYRPEEQLGQSVFEFIHANDLEAARRGFAEATAEPQASKSGNTRVRRKDGSWRILQVIGSTYVSTSGHKRFVINLHDTTNREAALEREREQLQTSLGDALAKVLSGQVTICIHCKNIRESARRWVAVEEFVDRRTDVRLSHGICPTCARSHYPEYDLNPETNGQG